MTHPQSDADLAACLPIDLRLPSATITKMTAGLSGAGVYRVEAGGQTVVLKTSAPDQALVYAGMRAGSVRVATPDGEWRVGLAMIKDGCTS